MKELFGLSMTTIMLVLLAAFAACLVTLVVVYFSNRIMFRMGLRNVRRRRAQSALVVAGLMLATVIITAAFATGDTIDYSITKVAYDNLQRTDLSIHHFRSERAPVEGDASVDEQRFVDEGVTAALERAFATDPDIAGFMPFLYEGVPVFNPRTRLSKPFVFFAGYDAGRLARFGGLHYADGRAVDLGSLGPDDVLVGKRAADDLEAKVGDTIQVFAQGSPIPLKVVGVIRDERASGALEPATDLANIAAPMATVQRVAGRTGKITTINVAIAGDVRSSLKRAPSAFGRLEAFRQDATAKEAVGLKGVTFQVEEVKQDVVDEAQLAGAAFTSVFVLLGLFSIAAGTMLIFTLFVMLAAERRTEMGIARAVGAQRINLIQSFLAEGVVYDVLAGFVGVALGVAAAFVIVVGGVRFLIGGELSFITAHVTLRSLVVSFCLGAVLTFITVVVSSFRVSHLNVVAAVRGQSDATAPREGRQRARWRWVAAGVPALVIPPLGVYWLLRKGLGLPWAWVLGPGGLAFAALMLWVGLATRQAFPWTLGVSLVPLSCAAIAGWFGAPARPTWTAVGLLLAYYWLAPSEWTEWGVGEMNGNMEMFVFSGIMIVTALTLIIVFNARLLAALFASRGSGGRYRPAGLLGLLAAGALAAGFATGDAADGLGQLFFLVAACLAIFLVTAVVAVRFPRFGPALTMGVAYPLASRFRTGMTIAMFSIVVFSITVMGIINASFLDMFSGDEGAGGWDLQVFTSRTNPIDDLAGELRAEGSFDPSAIAAAGRTTQYDDNSQQARALGDEWVAYPIIAGDDEFYRRSTSELEARARGYASDREVFEALRTKPNLALVDSSVLQQPFMGGNMGLFVDVDIEDGEFEPFTIEIRDPVSGRSEYVTVAGILSGRIPVNILFGVYTNEATYREILGQPEYRTWYLRLAPGTDSNKAAKAIKAALVTKGVEAQSIEKLIEDMLGTSRAFLRIFQAFMGLGLFVGIAALGVIALRSVVERRQQIGMLRAIGYQRGTVALSFILESGFIALMGILSGVVGATILSWNLLRSGWFAATSEIAFFVPWTEIGVYSVLAFVFALLMTWWPSRRAASVAIAEALRYE